MSARLLRQPLDKGWTVRRAGGPQLADVLPGLEDGIPEDGRLDAGFDATVPGCIHTDLLAAGLIPDPFVGDNELRVFWVAESDWEYSTTFEADEALLARSSVDLVAEGLDTLAEVRLNGEVVGRTDNMFRTWRWPVKALLQPGANRLVVRFASAPAWCAARATDRELPQANAFHPGAPWLRKAPYQFGWDWGPLLPTAGIWRPIRLEGYSARLDELQITQKHNGESVALAVAATVAGETEAGVALEVRIISPSGTVLSSEAEVHDGAASLDLTVADPELWWPNEMGAQPLYAVEVRLIDAAGDVLDSAVRRVGLRLIELRREPDRWGAGFVFAVNGRPFFAKGANWIPADSFPSRMTGEAYSHLLTSAAAAHMNMIRVWGGGVYEDDRFYDLCDRLGLLVWQDFMFSCAVYPFNYPDFAATVAVEVEDNVRRLRHHPCLALWCGNNELEAGWAHWGWDTPERADLKRADADFFYGSLRAAVARLDPDTPYWPGSPSSNIPHTIPQSEATGDAHRWEVWHDVRPLDHFLKQTPRFASEFGFQSLPAMATIAGFAPPAEWNITSYLMEHHQRNADGNGRMLTYMAYHFRMPRDFPSLVYLTQLLQAEAMRTAIEHWRRQWPRTGGALYWQLNDCWPVASWSSLDGGGRWKALHYAARRFFTPLHLSIEPGERLSSTLSSTHEMGSTGAAQTASATLWLHNDLADDVAAELRWALETLDGGVLQQSSALVTLPANSAFAAGHLDFTALLNGPNATSRRLLVLVAELWVEGVRRTLATHYFVPAKHLMLRDPLLRAGLRTGGDGQLTIRLEATHLARFVEVAFEGADVIFSDNAFDIPPGATVEVVCALPAGWDESRARDALRLRSLYDTLG